VASNPQQHPPPPPTGARVFTAGFSRRYTDGVREFTVEARNLSGVIKAMDAFTTAGVTISKKKPPSRLDGALHETAYPAIRPGCEIFYPQARGG